MGLHGSWPPLTAMPPRREIQVAETRGGTHITGVHTIGIPVADQERALRFYLDRLGFEKRLDISYGQGERWVEVAPPGSATTIALLRVGQGESAGIDTKIRLATSDASAIHADMRAHGITSDVEIMPYPVPMFAFRDPDGNRLIVVQDTPAAEG
jgi:catechol 2,3-dioxygenase-like lactoylglutathione lyase family enzyme